MKVIDLRCANGHGFEGWFASADDFPDQNGRGLIECPLCGDRAISRLPSAPRLNLSSALGDPSPAQQPPQEQQPHQQQQPQVPAPLQQATELQAAWLRGVRRLLASTEDVGERFPEEARRIHYGEVPHRGIRGNATEREQKALSDEGIEVLSLPIPQALKGPLQ